MIALEAQNLSREYAITRGWGAAIFRIANRRKQMKWAYRSKTAHGITSKRASGV